MAKIDSRGPCKPLKRRDPLKKKIKRTWGNPGSEAHVLTNPRLLRDLRNAGYWWVHTTGDLARVLN